MLDGLNDVTSSEWMLGVLRVSLSLAERALNAAASIWVRETTTEASMKAYSNSELRARSCEWRKPAFCTLRNSAAWT